MSRNLSEELDTLPEPATRTWKPQPLDKLVGRIVLRELQPSRYTGSAAVEHVIVEDETTGECLHVYANHFMLAKAIELFNPQPGDRIGIKRLPDIPGQRGYRYHVLVDRADPERPPDNGHGTAGVPPDPEPVAVPDDDIPF